MRSQTVDGFKITEARETVGLTQEALANKIGVGRSAVCYWESGRYQPSPANFNALCKALRVPRTHLLATPIGTAHDQVA